MRRTCSSSTYFQCCKCKQIYRWVEQALEICLCGGKINEIEKGGKKSCQHAGIAE